MGEKMVVGPGQRYGAHRLVAVDSASQRVELAQKRGVDEVVRGNWTPCRSAPHPLRETVIVDNDPSTSAGDFLVGQSTDHTAAAAFSTSSGIRDRVPTSAANTSNPTPPPKSVEIVAMKNAGTSGIPPKK